MAILWVYYDYIMIILGVCYDYIMTILSPPQVHTFGRQRSCEKSPLREAKDFFQDHPCEPTPPHPTWSLGPM